MLPVKSFTSTIEELIYTGFKTHFTVKYTVTIFICQSSEKGSNDLSHQGLENRMVLLKPLRGAFLCEVLVLS